MKHEPPSFKASAFNCPHCDAYAQMQWAILQVVAGGITGTKASLAHCMRCNRESVWWSPVVNANEGVMIYPSMTTAPLPHEDMPADVRADYEEARQIVGVSPRAASALLRLCIEKLCMGLKAEGSNINAQIAYLVTQGLPPKIAQAMDVVRVTGNNAVHPGQMEPDDLEAISATLFTLVNMVVEDRITRPRMIDDVYASLPQGALKAIENRDRTQ
jgi:hypothetical protein